MMNIWKDKVICTIKNLNIITYNKVKEQKFLKIN